MNRRNFLKAAGYAGLSLMSPFNLTRSHASQAGYDGLFFILVNANGGWDPTSFCDPKGRVDENETNPMNMYFKGDIRTVGNLSVAPVDGVQEFFEKYYQRLLVINGVDTSTNGHDSGTRHIWSGALGEGHPAFSSLVAANLGAERPLSFMSFGGYDDTRGIIAPTRTGNVDALERIAFPQRQNPSDENSTFHSAATQERIKRALAARTERKMRKESLSVKKQAIGSLVLARAGENEIARLTEFLPDLDNSPNRLRRQAQLAIAAYKAGVCVSANLNATGFDTHGDHDRRHFDSLRSYFEGVDFLLEEAERQGVADKVVVVMGSDFGRTPGYNAQNGKDHWSITSMMFAGAGITGNRVIGSTTERHRPINVDSQTLQPSETGVRITPAHIHHSMRELAGINQMPLTQRYPLSVQPLNLFA